MDKSVSVVIAIKGERNLLSLVRCVKSLHVQTVKPDEIIIVGEKEEIGGWETPKYSKSKTRVIKKYAKVDKNEARNVGILSSKGEYILYLDHDMVADSRLIEDCLNKSDQYDALIIPERGAGGTFWENCKKLERELIARDLHTVTARFYRKALFKNHEKPFDSSFGLLDEWGFSNKLMKRKVKLGYSDSYLLVKDNDFSIGNEISNKFKRGLWMRNFYQADKDDAWRRINPIKRGIIFYSQRLHYFFKSPHLFLGLILLKTIDFGSFMGGYFLGYLFRPKSNVEENDLTQHYDELGGNYLKQMYTSNEWTRYVDYMEKKKILEIFKLTGTQGRSEKILDLGMGPGRWVNFFLENHLGKLYGIDISPQMVKYAQKNIKNNNFKGVVAEMNNLPFESKTFDRVFCFRALKYVDNTSDVFSEVRRVLKKEGIFILEVSNNSLLNRLLKTVASIVVILGRNSSYKSKWGYFYRAEFYNKGAVTDMLVKQNFKILIVDPLFFLPSIPLPTAGGKLTNLWKIIDKLFFLILPKQWFCRSWIVVCENNN